jgi:hypothetical protein
MNRLNLIVGITCIAIILLISCNNEERAKKQYEQEYLCSNSAAESFKREYANADYIKVFMIVSSYTCHYNRKLYKCFILVH